MAAAKLNLKIEKGAKFVKGLLWRDSNKVAISLAPYLARMQIRQTIDSTVVIAELTTENGGIVLEAGGVTGKIDLYLGATVTDALTISDGVYDIELYNPTDVNDVVRLSEGLVTITDSVTR